jgi:phenylacetate-CoA ligase
MDWMQNVRWFDCFRLSPEVLASYHASLQRWRPNAMVCYASALASLAEVVEEFVARGAAPPTYPTRAFVTGAEKLHAHQRLLVQRLFGVPALERYGSRDVGLIGFQLPPVAWHAGVAEYDYTVDWPTVLVEPEQAAADGSPAAVLVTKLQADGMPMLRYRIGDLARFPRDARPGAPAFVLHEVTGRDVDRIWLSADRWITSLSFPHMLKDHPVREFQVLQRADLSVEVRLVTLPSFTLEDMEVIRSSIRGLLPGLHVDIVQVDELPRTRAGKLRPVISEVSLTLTVAAS